MNGKGDATRPRSVNAQTYADNYARTFSRQVDDPSGYDDRAKFCPPLDATTAALRDKHLNEARRVILNAPPMSPECRAQLDAAWKAWDAAYPTPEPK